MAKSSFDVPGLSFADLILAMKAFKPLVVDGVCLATAKAPRIAIESTSVYGSTAVALTVSEEFVVDLVGDAFGVGVGVRAFGLELPTSWNVREMANKKANATEIKTFTCLIFFVLLDFLAE